MTKLIRRKSVVSLGERRQKCAIQNVLNGHTKVVLILKWTVTQESSY